MTAKEPDGKKEDISDYDPDELEELTGNLMNGVLSALMQSPEIEDLAGIFMGR